MFCRKRVRPVRFLFLHEHTLFFQGLKANVDSLLAAGKLFVVDHELLEVSQTPNHRSRIDENLSMLIQSAFSFV